MVGGEEGCVAARELDVATGSVEAGGDVVNVDKGCFSVVACEDAVYALGVTLEGCARHGDALACALDCEGEVGGGVDDGGIGGCEADGTVFACDVEDVGLACFDALGFAVAEVETDVLTVIFYSCELFEAAVGAEGFVEEGSVEVEGQGDGVPAGEDVAVDFDVVVFACVPGEVGA